MSDGGKAGEVGERKPEELSHEKPRNEGKRRGFRNRKKKNNLLCRGVSHEGKED